LTSDSKQIEWTRYVIREEGKRDDDKETDKISQPTMNQLLLERT